VQGTRISTPSLELLIQRRQPNIQLTHGRRKAIHGVPLYSTPILTVCEVYLKHAHQIRSDTPQLHHGQLLPHAVVRTVAERHKGAFVDNGFGLLRGPALGQKGQRLTEVARVALHGVDGHPDDDGAGDIGAVGESDAFGWSFALNT